MREPSWQLLLGNHRQVTWNQPGWILSGRLRLADLKGQRVLQLDREGKVHISGGADRPGTGAHRPYQS